MSTLYLSVNSCSQSILRHCIYTESTGGCSGQDCWETTWKSRYSTVCTSIMMKGPSKYLSQFTYNYNDTKKAKYRRTTYSPSAEFMLPSPPHLRSCTTCTCVFSPPRDVCSFSQNVILEKFQPYMYMYRYMYVCVCLWLTSNLVLLISNGWNASCFLTWEGSGSVINPYLW